MKFVTFVRDDAVHTGALITGALAPEGDLILDFDDGGSGLPVAAGPLDWADTGAEPFHAAARLVEELDAERIGTLAEQGAVVPAGEVELLAGALQQSAREADADAAWTLRRAMDAVLVR